ncbi:MAG: beta strand repeat-containing protein [Candidatus Levyibacteriota bacterium]
MHLRVRNKKIILKKPGLFRKRIFFLGTTAFSILSAIFLFFFIRHALGATATWTNGGGDGLWSNCANWSGGTGTGGCPGTNDIATFNSTSTANAAIDTNVSVAGISIASSYTGTITQNTTKTVTIGASGYSQAGGTFTGGDSAITLNNTSGSFSLTGGTFSNTSGTMSIVKNMTVNGGTFNNTGTVLFNSQSFSGGYTQTLSCSGSLPGTFDIAQQTYNTQTFALGSGCTITLATNVSTIGSITNSGTMNATNITMTAASFTQSGTLNLTGTLKFNGQNFSGQLTQTLSCTGNLTSSGGIVDVAQQTYDTQTFALGSGCNITLATNVSTVGFITNSGTMNATNITMTGASFTQSGTLNLTGTLKFNGQNFSGQLTQTLSCTGNLTSSGGIVDIAQQTYDTQTFALGSGCSITLATNVSTIGSITNSGTMNATNITMTGASFTQSGTLNLTGTLKFNANNSSGQLTQTLTCTGNLTSSGGIVDIAQQTYDTQTFALGSGCTITLATNVSTIGSITNSGTMNATNVTITRNLTQNGTLLLSGNLTFNNGSFNQTSTLSCTSPVTGNVVINKTTYSSSYFIMGSDCTITGNFTRTAGYVNNPASGYTLTVIGNFSLSSTDPFGGSNMTIKMAGSGNQTVSQSGGTFSSIFTVNKTGGTASLSTDFTVTGQACTVAAGTFYLNAKAFSCSTGFTVQNGGSLQLQGTETPTTPTLDTGSTVTFVGNGDSLANSYTAPNWTYSNFSVNMTDSNDTLNAPAATTTIPGDFVLSGGIFSAPAVLNVASNFTYSGGTFTNNSGLVDLNGSGIQNISGSTSFYDFTAAGGATKVLVFAAGATQTITHTLTFTGTANTSRMPLRSSTTGAQWNIASSGTANISYVNVRDSNACSGNTLVPVDSHNSGNNSCWTLGAVTYSADIKRGVTIRRGSAVRGN